MPVISTRQAGLASRASTVMRAGLWRGSIQASQARFMAAKSAMVGQEDLHGQQILLACAGLVQQRVDLAQDVGRLALCVQRASSATWPAR